MADSDAANERLNGLVHLLNVFGIDGANPDALAKGAHSQGASGDQRILELLGKLHQAQTDSPEILAALQSPELRALASLAAQRQPEAQRPKPAASLDDVMDDDDNYPKIGPGYSDDISVVSDLTTPTIMPHQQVPEEEYYRDINGGGSKPPMNVALGPAQPSRPPMNVGGRNMMPASMMASNLRNPPKTKNLVGQVRPGATRRAIASGKMGVGAGGAAAQRRHNYQQAMAKLQSTGSDQGSGATIGSSGYSNPNNFVPSTPSNVPDPMDFPSMADTGKKNRSQKKQGQKTRSKKSSLASQELHNDSFDDSMASGDSRGELSRKKSGMSHGSGSAGGSLDWGSSHGRNNVDASGWPSFDQKSSKKKSGSAEKDVFMDSDGFFANSAFGSGDPFAPASSKSPATRRKHTSDDNRVSRDDGQGGSRTSRSKAAENAWASEKSSKKDREKKSRGRGRRASLSM